MKPWPRTLTQYGAIDTYRLAAAWLQDCPTIADWGGAASFFRRCLPPWVRYTIVDGTAQRDAFVLYGDVQVLADLVDYHEPSDGILLRHVLDNTPEWLPILCNAIEAFRQRLVVVTFTPDAPTTRRIEHKNGWPTWTFDPTDLRAVMGKFLVRDEAVPTTHPERVYYLERAA